MATEDKIPMRCWAIMSQFGGVNAEDWRPWEKIEGYFADGGDAVVLHRTKTSAEAALEAVPSPDPDYPAYRLYGLTVRETSPREDGVYRG